MSETRIVNRVPETLGQEIERKRLEAETGVSQVEKLEAEHDDREFPAPLTAQTEYHVPPHVGGTVVLQPDQTVRLEPMDTVHSPAADLISKLLKERAADMVRTEFLAFKDQVIRAFKHLGLDTRKHFGV